MDKKVTKNYKEILKGDKKLAKNILYTIVITNLKNQKIDKNNNFTNKLIVTREQKDDLQRLSKAFLIDSLDFNNLTNKQLYKSILYAFKGNYTRVDTTKTSIFYDFKDTISVMDFWRYVGWQLLGLQIEDRVIKAK